MQWTSWDRGSSGFSCIFRGEKDFALGGIVVAVEGHREALLPVGAGWGPGPRRALGGLGGRGSVTQSRVHMVVVGALRLVVDVCLVNQRDAVHRVVDDKLRMRHEVVDWVPGLWLLHAVIEGATEGIHHPDLKSNARGRGGGSRAHNKIKRDGSTRWGCWRDRKVEDSLVWRHSCFTSESGKLVTIG